MLVSDPRHGPSTYEEASYEDGSQVEGSWCLAAGKRRDPWSEEVWDPGSGEDMAGTTGYEVTKRSRWKASEAVSYDCTVQDRKGKETWDS